MTEPFDNLPDDIRANIVVPKQKDLKVVAVSDPVYVKDVSDTEYDKRIQSHIDLLNKHSQILERDRNSLALEIQELIKKQQPVLYNGQNVYQVFHSLNNQRQQNAVNLFHDFAETNAHYVFDIETVGDSQDRVRPYGITEISLNQYDKNGDLKKEVYNGLIQQDKTVIDSLQETLNKIKKDRYHFNTLEDWEKRSIVDLMRYSTYKDEYDKNAFSTKGGIHHHSIIDSVFDYKDRVDHGKVIREMDSYVKYMQSGLNTLKSTGDSPEKALGIIIKTINKDPNAFFVSYNGNNFDIPVLKAFAEKHKLAIPEHMNHMDLLNVIRTVYMDSDELKRQIDSEYTTGKYNKDKQAAFVELLGENQVSDEFHNARVDVDNLAKVTAMVRDPIAAEIKKNHTKIQQGYNYMPTHMTWNEEELKTGQQLFANNGYNAYHESEESFRMKLDENGKWVQASNGYDKTVLQAKTFYQFAGHIEGAEAEKQLGDKNKQAFRFYDPERNEYSYIVRSGNPKSGATAFNELQDFVHSRFYNWDNVDDKMKEQVQHIIETDRARRRYDRYFSMDGGGKGLNLDADGNVVERGTKGFSGLKRMMKNAETMQKHLESHGEIYRERVAKYRAEGLSESAAKEKARMMPTKDLLGQLDFNSLWDPQTSQFIHNQREQDAFFKMHQRLIDERPYYEKAIEMIDAQYQQQIQLASKEKNHTIRNDTFQKINQKRDEALLNYHEKIINEVGAPTKTRKVLPFETYRLPYYDPKSDNMKSLNFSTVGTAHSNMYQYAKQGVEENHQNRQRVMKERLNNLIQNLHGQRQISTKQLKHYQKIILNNDSVWSASQEIAGHMKDASGSKYESTITEDWMHGNTNIKKLNPSVNKEFIQRSIDDVNNAQMWIHSNQVEGKKLELGQEIRKTLDILDQQRFSQLHPNNAQALEELVSGIQKANKDSHIALVMDTKGNSGNVKVYTYDGKNSVSVRNQLDRGTVPSQAVEINMPLINRTGTHQIGGLTLNAHSYAVRDGKDIKMISSAQYIAKGYNENIGRIMQLQKEGKIEEANRLVRRTLRNQIENMSGIQRNMIGENDTYKWSDNFSDELKQSHIKVGNAMVEDFFYNGYDNMKLTESDFYNADDVFEMKNGERVLKRGVGLQDVQMETQYKMLMKMNKWSQEKLGMDVFTSSVKAEHVSKGTVSMTDIRQMVPYGSFFNHGRDNTVQYMNAYLINDETKENIKGMKGVSRNRLLETPDYYESGKGNLGINMKTAFMSQDQLRERINEMHLTEEGTAALSKAGLLNKDGSLNHIALPRLYEQQGIIAKDVSDALSVDNEKRYAKGKQFKLHSSLLKDQTVQPGQILGAKIHDNGHKEVIRYQGNKTAQLVQGSEDGEDLVLQWKSRPFKIMLDGEKMTDSPVDRSFIKSLTGQDDIVAILNPDVAKHKDFGMLMSGQARLLAEHVNNTKGSKQKTLIKAIEGANVGLKWNADMGGFMDHSFGMNIHKRQFDALYEKLGISNRTDTGNYYMGILEGHLSKVSNYSKVTDATGQRVIGHQEGWDAATGEYHPYKKIYIEDIEDGVRWGHREMGVLKSKGMEETYQHVYDIMMDKQEKTNKSISRLQESKGIIESLQNMSKDEDVKGIHASEFESLPEQYRNMVTYKGTIFDREAVESIAERAEGRHRAIGQHGFYLELPSVQRTDNKTNKITVRTNESGKTKELDRIFIPFTNVEGANGDVHLRELQKNIKSIYERAKSVEQAGTIEEARTAHEGLQRSVQRYVNQSFKELTSSDGMLFGDIFKTGMGGTVNGVKTSSASGLFKLMDYETSLKYGDGQHTIISEQMAKDMGVFDQLKAGKELHAANVRYPTFHDGAMQFTKLHMDESVRPGEIHTSSFSSMLQNADSDGDYSHITVMEDDKIQAEWKRKHDSVTQDYADRWEKHLKDEDSSREGYERKSGVDLTSTTKGQRIRNQLFNSDEETASKIGKMTIGRASNLNLYMRQVADRFYDNDMNYKIKEFGRGLEQKLIDAKHGAKPVGLQMIDHIYAGEWDQAMELDNTHFEGMFQDKYNMREVSQEMPIALQNLRNGLKTQGLKFGTSTGVSSSQGIQNLMDLLYGGADPKDFGGDNNALAMMHKYLNETEDANITRFNHEELPPMEGSASGLMKQKLEIEGKLGHMRNLTSDAIGGSISNLGGKVKNLFQSIKGMGAKKAAILGGSLAVAGIAGYNILNTEKPELHYMNEEKPSPQQPREPKPAIDTGIDDYNAAQNASIHVQASGGKISQDMFSHAVTQGMKEAGMQSGPTRVSVNHQDNTQQLNRQWYRDKVRENI